MYTAEHIQIMIENRRIREIDILRGLAAVLMILGHSFITYPVDISRVPWCAAIGHFIYTFHMELFFVLAGVVYKCINYKEFVQSKLKRLIVPYALFGGIALVMKAIGGSLVNRYTPIVDGLFRYLFCGGNYWFIYTLFIILVLYPLLERIFKTERSQWILFALFILLDRVIPQTDFLRIGSVIDNYPYFVFGRIFSRRVLKGISKEKSTLSLILGLLGIYLCIDLLETALGLDIGILNYARALSMVSALFLIVNSLIDIMSRNRLCTSFILLLETCGRYSLQMYLFNSYLLTVLRTIICNILDINTPSIIVLGIWLGNLIIILSSCKWILPRIPGIRQLCSL